MRHSARSAPEQLLGIRRPGTGRLWVSALASRVQNERRLAADTLAILMGDAAAGGAGGANFSRRLESVLSIGNLENAALREAFATMLQNPQEASQYMNDLLQNIISPQTFMDNNDP